MGESTGEGKLLGHLNCWEYMLCGREPGGTRTKEFDTCPAAKDKRLDGVHGGKNAGRACWVVAGSFAREDAECAFAKEHVNCATCDFYYQVKKEEGRYLWPVTLLHRIL